MRSLLSRFQNCADDYSQRPDYPAAAADVILEGLAAAEITVADIGSGTGISSRFIAQRGPLVLAVEPEPRMRARSSPHERVIPIEAVAEATGLRAHSIDVVLCAQSFHWFEHDAALREFSRILRSSGRLAIMWNGQCGGDEFSDRYQAILREAVRATESGRRSFPLFAIVQRSGRFGVPSEHVFGHTQQVTHEGLLQRTKGVSALAARNSNLDMVVRDLSALHAEFADNAGVVTLQFKTYLYIWSKMAPD